MAITYTQQETTPVGKRAAASLRKILGRQEVIILLLTVVLTLFFYSRNPAMLTPTVWIGILRTMAFPALIAMGL